MAERTFLVFNTDSSDDRLVEAIAAREMEIASYELNIQNYEDILAMSDLTSEYRAQVTQILSDTRRELKKSESVYAALLNRRPTGDRWEAAMTRYAARHAQT